VAHFGLRGDAERGGASQGVAAHKLTRLKKQILYLKANFETMRSNFGSRVEARHFQALWIN
jgi:hypothetical protein